jgi:hypothetical protein
MRKKLTNLRFFNNFNQIQDKKWQITGGWELTKWQFWGMRFEI